jgi:sucrose-6-phosphate hydrolase SacC (GH32 family)
MLVLLLALGAFMAAAEPNTCQPRSRQPFMPIYHTIGNVTTDANGLVTNVESINDLSSVILYKGIYHVFHQCCQNHWDHVVSKDLIHWTRLPPPIVPNMNPTGVAHPDWYDAHGSWDGSLQIPNEWNGITEPVVVMTAVPGTKPGSTSEESKRPEYVPRTHRNWTAGAPQVGMAMQMAIVRATNASDPFLVSWTKDAANPINFNTGQITSPYDTPGQIWRNGDHWNFLILGNRYTTKDPTFHTWDVVKEKFANFGENGGQWFSKLANLQDGKPPPAGSPGWMMNVAGGNKYALGSYNRENESWSTINSGATIDYGPDDNWMVGQFAGNRFMNIGWSTGGPPMMVDEYPEETSHLYTQRPTDAPQGSCAFTKAWEVFPLYTNIYNRMPSPTNVTHGTLKFMGEFGTVDECFAAVNASTDGPFHSFTWNDDTNPPEYAQHCWGDTSMRWQNRGGCKGQISGRGPGFPIQPPLPPSARFTRDHLTGLREVAYDPRLQTLISNPIKELINLRNGTLASEKALTVSPGKAHVVAGTGAPADASTSDVVVSVKVPSATGAVGVSVLANVSAGVPFGGILVVVNFTAPDSNGTINALASIRTLNPCGSGSGDLRQAPFPILKGEAALDMRILVDRSIVEVFVMGGRAVFSKTYNPAVLYVPDTNIALQAWGTAVTASVDVHSMGCGWTNPPYQPHPTMDSVSSF